MDSSLNLVKVFQGSPMDAEIVKDILMDNQIEVNVRNEFMGTIAPWHVTPGGFNPVEIEVLEKDFDAAIELVKAFNNSKSSSDNFDI